MSRPQILCFATPLFLVTVFPGSSSVIAVHTEVRGLPTDDCLLPSQGRCAESKLRTGALSVTMGKRSSGKSRPWGGELTPRREGKRKGNPRTTHWPFFPSGILSAWPLWWPALAASPASHAGILLRALTHVPGAESLPCLLPNPLPWAYPHHIPHHLSRWSLFSLMRSWNCHQPQHLSCFLTRNIPVKCGLSLPSPPRQPLAINQKALPPDPCHAWPELCHRTHQTPIFLTWTLHCHSILAGLSFCHLWPCSIRIVSLKDKSLSSRPHGPQGKNKHQTL